MRLLVRCGWRKWFPTVRNLPTLSRKCGAGSGSDGTGYHQFQCANFVDGNDVIENLGIDNIVKIKKSAAIAKAESERDIKVAQAAADKESNDGQWKRRQRLRKTE